MFCTLHKVLHLVDFLRSDCRSRPEYGPNRGYPPDPRLFVFSPAAHLTWAANLTYSALTIGLLNRFAPLSTTLTRCDVTAMIPTLLTAGLGAAPEAVFLKARQAFVATELSTKT